MVDSTIVEITVKSYLFKDKLINFNQQKSFELFTLKGYTIILLDNNYIHFQSIKNYKELLIITINTRNYLCFSNRTRT